MTDTLASHTPPHAAERFADLEDKARQCIAAGDGPAAAALSREMAHLARDAKSHFALGNLLLATDDAEAALCQYRSAARLAPEVAEVHINFAAAALRLGQPSEAEAAARRAVGLRSGSAAAHAALGSVLLKQGRLEEAETAYRTACSLEPNSTAAHHLGLGHALLDLGRAGEAEDVFLALQRRGRGNPAALNGAGLARQHLFDHAGAETHFRAALAVDPRHADAWGNLAVTLQSLGQHEDALEACRQALALKPDSGALHANLGHILQGLGRHQEAVEAYERALTIDPRQTGIAAYLLHSRRHECLWEGDRELSAAVVAEAASGRSVVPPFALAGTDASSAVRLKAAHRSAAEHGRPGAPSAQSGPRPAKAASDAPLRIGFVSPDFRTHSFGMTFGSVVAARDPCEAAWIGYSTGAQGEDRVRRSFMSAFDAMVDLGSLPTAAAAERIRADRIDVLVDLAGHTRGAWLELFAMEAAPVQAHYLGYGSTVGAAYIPWLITDERHTPAWLVPCCSESLVYLPHSFMAASRVNAAATLPDRNSEGLPRDAVVFANFNAHYKFDPGSFDLWTEILREVPGSVLWLRAGSESAMARLRDAAVARGIAAERLVFAKRRDHDDHLARHALADVALDTLQHAGGVTTLDALKSGVPTVTIAGLVQSARTGVSILAAADLPDLIATDREDYVRRAVALALDPAALRRTKERVRKSLARAPLFDGRLLASHLNAAFRLMHVHGTKPARQTVLYVDESRP